METDPDPALRILYLDDRICALEKPSGIMVHRTGITTDRIFLVDLLRAKLGRRIWTVHRLDRATSGVLLFALDREMAGVLGRQFEAGTVGKRYLAVVRGWLDDGGEIDKSLRTGANRLRDALTVYRCLARTELPVAVAPHATSRYSLASVEPKTGRMHQIRRHFNHVSHPIVGDVNHGDRHHNRLFRERFDSHRLLLHAASLDFMHPDLDRRLALAAALPPDFSGLLEQLGWSDALDPTGEPEPRPVSDDLA
ncbi:MAG: pseudouridine synthase [Wenzhouxiangellaceae bacterium]|nr:pseudouridine synthase [Wenzhouxiangellaceae bacterium]